LSVTSFHPPFLRQRLQCFFRSGTEHRRRSAGNASSARTNSWQISAIIDIEAEGGCPGRSSVL
jgi:hypothetical protein